MSRPINAPRFAKKRELNLRSASYQVRTPLLVPSFSSKGFPEVGKIIELTQPFLDSQILVSAYDLYHGHISSDIDLNFPPLIFVDSGGYEASQDRAMQDPARPSNTEYNPSEDEWKEEYYSEIISAWDKIPPTVFINFDHPNKRVPLNEQISDALRLGGAGTQLEREFLIKPNTDRRHYLDVDEICANIKKLSPFIAIGVTEDEIGNTPFNRMVQIGRLRRAMNAANMDLPIHVFGSLDTVTTLLYFVMGADIFDGLTWLRYGYSDGETLYQPSLSAIKFPKKNTKSADLETWRSNYIYLQDMELQMRSFLTDGDFSRFGKHADEIEKLYVAAVEELGE